MGKHFWTRHLDDDSSKKQQSWAWGLVRTLGHHHWRFSINKMIKYHKLSSQPHENCNWNPFDDESEKLVHASPRTKKRSIRARIKAFIGEEVSGSKGNKKSRETSEAKAKTDVLEIFKIDKELLEKHLQDADEGIASFSLSALRSNSKLKLIKSGSFPAVRFPDSVKLKPVTLENKLNDVWLVPREDKTTNPRSYCVRFFDNDTYGKTENLEVDYGRKMIQRRCFSVNESVEKYTCLFENMKFSEDFKLNSSKSLRLANENAHSNPKHSLSDTDFRDSNTSLKVIDQNLSQDATFPADNRSIAARINIEEDETLSISRSENNDPVLSDEGDDRRAKNDEFTEPELVIESDSDEENSISAELQIQLDIASDDAMNRTKSYKAFGEEIKNTSDLEYVRQLINESSALEIQCHSSEQPLSPSVFEQVEARFCHEQDEESTSGLDDFCGFLHHQMMFDLVNEMLIDIHEISEPYYPKPLSSICQVKPFPCGKYMVDEVCARAGSVMNLKPEEKQSMNRILSFDYTHDRRWMNLQVDAESVAICVEDMVFHELLEEIVHFL